MDKEVFKWRKALIPILGNNIRDILGKLGAWPCDFGPETAVALYNVAVKNLPSNGTAVDLTPSAGKTTVVLSAAAYRNGAKTTALVNQAEAHPAEIVWLNRAYRTFKMKDTCTLAEEIMQMTADMVVVRGNAALAQKVFADGLKPDGILFGINIEKLDGVEPEQTGGGWAVWRKPKMVTASIKDETRMPPDSALNDSPKSAKQTFLDNTAMYSPSLSEVAEAIVITEEEAQKLRAAQEG